jgi:mannan endo-1,4-beta-mannosidase
MRNSLQLIACSAALFLNSVILPAQGTKYEAESGTLTGTFVASSSGGFSGTGYVDGFDNDGDKVTVTFTLPQEGNYNIYVGYAGIYGDKKNILSINGNSTEMSFPASSGFVEAAYGRAAIKAGSNTLAII